MPGPRAREAKAAGSRKSFKEQRQDTNGTGFKSDTVSWSPAASTAGHSQRPGNAEGLDWTFLWGSYYIIVLNTDKILHRKDSSTVILETNAAIPRPPDHGCTHIPLFSSLPSSDSTRIVYINQSPSLTKSWCAAPNIREGEQAHLTSVHTQLELPSPRCMTSMLSSGCTEPPSPSLCNSRHLQY